MPKDTAGKVEEIGRDQFEQGSRRYEFFGLRELTFSYYFRSQNIVMEDRVTCPVSAAWKGVIQWYLQSLSRRL